MVTHKKDILNNFNTSNQNFVSIRSVYHTRLGTNLDQTKLHAHID
ncbi:hypothetical protein BH09VER1_BH09VER1_47290 [soil metagenome]